MHRGITRFSALGHLRFKAHFHYLACYSCNFSPVLCPGVGVIRALAEFCLVLLKGTTTYPRYTFPFSSSIEYSKQPIWSSIIGFGAYVLPYLTTSIPSAQHLFLTALGPAFVFPVYILDATREVCIYTHTQLSCGICQYVVYYLRYTIFSTTIVECEQRNNTINLSINCRFNMCDILHRYVRNHTIKRDYRFS